MTPTDHESRIREPQAMTQDLLPLPSMLSTDHPLWRAILAWEDAPEGPEAGKAADHIDKVFADQMRAYARDNLAAAPQPAPVVPDGNPWARLDQVDLGPLKITLTNPDAALAFLQRAGLVGADGKLTEAYGGDSAAPQPQAAQAVGGGEREALQIIADWNSHTTEFAVDYGSNGVRDFYRNIARAALQSAQAVGEAK